MDLQKVHDDLHLKINEVDEVLDSQDDQKSVGKRKLVNEMIEESKPAWEAVAEQLVAQLNSQDPKVKIGIFYGLTRHLNSTFAKGIGEEVEAMVADIPEAAAADKISDDELAKLSAVRSELYKKVKQLVETGEMFGADNEYEFKMPRKRTGSRGKRGPRAITAFSWAIDDKGYDTLKEVAADYSSTYEKVGELTAAMREAGLDLKEPGERLEFTLPDGKTLIGEKDPDKVVKEDEDNVVGDE